MCDEADNNNSRVFQVAEGCQASGAVQWQVCDGRGQSGDQSERSNSANQKRERQVYLARSRAGDEAQETSTLYVESTWLAVCLFRSAN